MSHCCTECRSLSLEVKTGTAIHFESVLRTRLYRPTEYLCAAESSLHPNHLKPWGPCKHLALLLLRVRNVAPEQIWQIKGQKLILTSFDLTTLNGTKKTKKGGFFAYRCTFVLPYHLSSCCGAVGRVWLPKIKRLLTFLLRTKAALKSVSLFRVSDWEQSRIKMEILGLCVHLQQQSRSDSLTLISSVWVGRYERCLGQLFRAGACSRVCREEAGGSARTQCKPNQCNSSAALGSSQPWQGYLHP